MNLMARRCGEVADRNGRAKVRAETEAARAAAEKSSEEARRERLQTLRTIVVTAAVAYGVLAVFLYLYVEGIGFVSGLTAGDSLFFAFVAVALGAIGGALSGFGALAVAPLFALASKARSAAQLDDSLRVSQQRRDTLGTRLLALVRGRWGVVRSEARHSLPFQFVLAVMVLAPEGLLLPGVFESDFVKLFNLTDNTALIVMLAAGVASWSASAALLVGTKLADGWAEAIAFGFAVMVAHWVLGLLLSSKATALIFMAATVGGGALAGALDLLDAGAPTGSTYSHRGSRFFAVVALIAGAMVLPAGAALIDITGKSRNQALATIFSGLGVRSEDVTVRLSSSAADTIRSASLLHGTRASLCRLQGSGYLLSDAIVLWHGIGSRTYLRWPARGSRTGRKVLMTDVPSAEVSIVRGPSLRCVDVPDSAFFESGRAELNPDARYEIVTALLSHLSSAKEANQELVGLDVIGNADPMPVDGGNRQLALDRAKQVLKAVEESGRLVGKIDMAKVERRAVSNGARDPLKECSSRETLDYQRECNAPNRRVELRLRFTAIELPKGVRR